MYGSENKEKEGVEDVVKGVDIKLRKEITECELEGERKRNWMIKPRVWIEMVKRK